MESEYNYCIFYAIFEKQASKVSSYLREESGSSEAKMNECNCRGFFLKTRRENPYLYIGAVSSKASEINAILDDFLEKARSMRVSYI
jgi:hypothetical protein